MKEATPRKALDAIEQLGYRPNQTARSLKTKKSQQIAVLVPAASGVHRNRNRF
ncbi:hypothetical protein [Paenibacillus spongiae]|uniref:HTH lacI-type domain-containing protein n=1 Tax=Paenibacillus spongiae TaxID=2909671 RepID=A0ABY5S5F8_9BACL|nr:hypothetical protein [Paenibacillus spongiae]UVI29136.1 hypothetical protein L1F29_27475 [Paenibacillus spongiae]